MTSCATIAVDGRPMADAHYVIFTDARPKHHAATWIRAASLTPAAIAAAFNRCGASLLVVPDEQLAQAIQSLTSRPVVTSVLQSPAAVAVVVTCHNYGRYLRQCLDSILSQTLRPSTIIVVDDGSDDDTPEIAADYSQQGVQYLRTEFRDVALARNAGAAFCGKPDYYLFVDADNWLPAEYLATLQAGMTARTIGVTYGHLDQVDSAGNPIGRSPAIKPFSLPNLRRQNLADTCSLIRRQAFEQANGWRSYGWGLHDWDLWLRITAGGWQMRLCDQTALHYRIHPTRMSAARVGRYECGMEVMRESQQTAIVSLFSGLTWNLNRWFGSLLRLRWNHRNLHLVAVDNSGDSDFRLALQSRLDASGITYTLVSDDSRIVDETPSAAFTDSAASRISHSYRMNIHLSRLYALASEYLPAGAANVLSLEDDVEIPPDGLATLATELFRLRAGAVSACLRNRFHDRGLLAWTAEESRIQEAPVDPLQITSIGFYCLLVCRAAWDTIAWRPGVTGTDRHPYYDWAASADVRASGPIYLIGTVRCRHWQADGTVLDV